MSNICLDNVAQLSTCVSFAWITSHICLSLERMEQVGRKNNIRDISLYLPENCMLV